MSLYTSVCQILKYIGQKKFGNENIYPICANFDEFLKFAVRLEILAFFFHLREKKKNN